MTRERAKGLLPIIQAYAEGKTILNRRKDSDLDWVEGEPSWADNYEYRIKPEPREWWIVNYDGRAALFHTKELALKERESGREVIHVREVLP